MWCDARVVQQTTAVHTKHSAGGIIKLGVLYVWGASCNQLQYKTQQLLGGGQNHWPCAQQQQQEAAAAFITAAEAISSYCSSHNKMVTKDS
jgi:hypothetical protein